MTDLTISLRDRATLGIVCSAGIARELNDHFTFKVPGYKHMPAYKNGAWDGKIKLFNLLTGELLAGLFPYVQKFCEDRKYSFEVVSSEYGTPGAELEIDQEFFDEFYAKLNLPFDVRDYQNTAITHAIRKGRALLICPTGSGKSFIAYILMRFFLGMTKGKVMIIVPSTSLVAQLLADFKSYNYDIDKVHIIYSGKDKFTNKRVVITTWQSIYKLPQKWFDQYDAIIGDEAHNFKAKSLMSIMNKSTNAQFRIGMTGTLDGTQTHKLVLEGVFGIEKVVTKTKKLQDEGVLAQANFYIPMLEHDDTTSNWYWSEFGQREYKEELAFLEAHEKRNNFIANLAVQCKGNTLVLFRHKAHGRILYDLIKSKVPETRKVFYISGDVDVDDREAIRQIVEKLPDAIIVASGGTFSTGINIRNLHNIVMALSWKTRIKVLQSIGRGLRIADNGEATTVFDIMDIIADTSERNRLNTTLRHGLERLKLYKQEGFPFKTAKVKL